ncbi:hypothetical protein G6011_02793 [Alternaria panax]|uniref:BTB domain-containing protein n=1 Tax=Alternaria panax TaxID=48097 RepID=A0AAD4I5M4_9PLEO|nr:hypothetical protein G6011_02793 [Alternaria panax]
MSQVAVLTSLASALHSEAYSDLVITCGGEIFKVHKVIICERAEFFARAVRFSGKETGSGTIDLPEDEPSIIKLLIHYLYFGEYEPRLPEDDDRKGLCDVVSKTISENMELVEVPEVKVLMTAFNGLALGILKQKIKEHGWRKKE